MPATDMKRIYKSLYGAVRKDPGFVTVPDLPYLMIDGEGDPSTSAAFREGIEALYGLSYILKFQLKKEGKDYTVMPLEGLFCAEDMTAFKEGRRNEWKWTLMIMQPKEITEKKLAVADEDLRKKRKLPAPLPVRLETLREGLCAHILHIGPYAEEGHTINRLHRFIEAEGFGFHGTHHEIYLSDPNRTQPARMRTIIRQPVAGLP